MTNQHVEDGAQTFDRIGHACDRLGAAGFPEIQAAVVGYTRERRGRVQASGWPGRIARSLIHLADELEQLVERLQRQEQPELVHFARHPEHGTDCHLCELGDAELCVECLCQDVLDARAQPGSPYASPTPEEFQAAEEKAREDVERVAAMNEQLGEHAAVSMYDRRPANRGPSWYRTIAAA